MPAINGEQWSVLAATTAKLDRLTRLCHRETVPPNLDAAISEIAKLINRTLADSSFSFYANHWWEAARPYIDQERRVLGGDMSVLSEFETFVGKIRKHDPRIDDKALKNFLACEKQLR